VHGVRAFACSVCHRLVTFEGSLCLNCGADLAFDPQSREIVGLRAGVAREEGDGVEVVPADPPPGAVGPEADEERWRCANAELIACNWLAAADGELCPSCTLTRTRPADGDAEGLERFASAERSKRRLIFELGELGLPIVDGQVHEGGLVFELLSSAQAPVTTGHADGVITMDLAEDDDAHREAMRLQLNERYRTVLGHLRHEVGHWYWTVLVGDGEPEHAALLERARELFGDEREDYGEALDRHYADGAPEDWPQHHVSAYSTMHPAEDWAETFAHYLHLFDALQTAAAYRVSVAGPEHVTDPAGTFAGRIEAPVVGRFPEALDQWLPLSYALNALNRSLGHEDLYPFVLAPAVVEKLAFVDRAVAAAAAPSTPAE
jgi:hypothetical protein